MRPLESYCIYLCLFVVWHGSRSLPLWWTELASWALLAALIAHCLLEQPRWQLTLVYAQAVHLLYSILFAADSASAWPAGWLFILFSSAALMCSSALACLFPVAKFPELRGRFRSVGLTHRFWPTVRVAGSVMRVPAGVQDPQRYNHLAVTAYYPSALEAPTGGGAPFLSSGVLRGLARFLSMPPWLLGYVRLGRIRAVPDLPLVSAKQHKEKLPVLVLSHGLGGTAGMYAITACELASQGFVVLAPTHNDGSASLAELPAGLSVAYRPPPGSYGSADMLKLRQEQLLTRAAELSHVIDVLVEAEKSGSWPVPVPFAGRLDLTRVGVLGHSFGAATAALTAEQDERVQALVANDLWMLPLPSSMQAQGLQRRGLRGALLTQSAKWTAWSEQHGEVLSFTRACVPPTSLLNYPGTGHSNYSDVPLFSQMVARKLGQIGAADFRQAANSINDAQTAFFKAAMRVGEDAEKGMTKDENDDERKPLPGPAQLYEPLLRSKRAELLATSPSAMRI